MHVCMHVVAFRGCAQYGEWDWEIDAGLITCLGSGRCADAGCFYMDGACRLYVGEREKYST
jgi:hypothetical protein